MRHGLSDFGDCDDPADVRIAMVHASRAVGPGTDRCSSARHADRITAGTDPVGPLLRDPSNHLARVVVRHVLRNGPGQELVSDWQFCQPDVYVLHDH